jgi:DNA-binding NtrC family response regulator
MIMRDGDGALRELNAKIESTNGVISGRNGVIALEDERTKMGRSGMRSIMRDVKDRTEAQLIQDALDVSGWNRRHAAKYLNISYRGLLYKIRQHHLSPKQSARA